MQKLKNWVSRRHRLLALLAVAAAALAVLAWAGYDLGQRVDNQPVYQIANDQYSQTIEIPRAPEGGTAEMEIPLTVPGDMTLYGVRLNIATYNHAFAEGTLYARVSKDDGEVYSTAAVECITLKDNTFATLIFDTPFAVETNGDEIGHANLLLWYTMPATDPSPLGLWASEGACAYVDKNGDPLGTALPMMSSFADGNKKDYDATPALQFVTDYSGRWSHTLSLVLGVLLFVAVVGGFALLYRTKAKLPLVFLAGGVVLGGAFALVTPPLVAPDEYTHLTAAYRQASSLLGQQNSLEKDGTLYLTVRACDAPYFRDNSGDVGIFAYKTMLEHLADTGAAPASDTVTAIDVTYAPINGRLYLGQTLGILLARVLGLGFFGMVLLGRLGSLTVYAALAALAVAWAPKRLQGMFACVGLLPMAVQLAGSLSGDSLVLGLAFGYTALCLALRERPARRWQLCLLAVYAVYMAPLKAIYLPLVLLCLMIPNEHLAVAAKPERLSPRRQGWLIKGALLLLAALAWAAGNGSALLYATRDVDNVGLTRAALAMLAAAAVLGAVYWKARRNPKAKRAFWAVVIAGAAVAAPVAVYKLTHMWGGLTPEALVGSVQANGDSIYTYSVGYICRNLPSTIKLLLRSISAQGALWLQGVLGTVLGEPIVYPVMVSWVLGVGLVLALLASVLPQVGEPPRLGCKARWGTALVLLAVVALSVLAALTWTPINYQTIFGLQGRYWLPVLPLALLLAGETPHFRAQKLTARGAVYAVTVLCAFVLLQGYGIYATFAL